MYCMSTVFNILNKSEENEEGETEREDSADNVALAKLVSYQLEENERDNIDVFQAA